VNNTTDQQCWDFINANMFTANPMAESYFRDRKWDEIREIGPDISGNVYLAGINELGCRGYWCPQREVGSLAPGA